MSDPIDYAREELYHLLGEVRSCMAEHAQRLGYSAPLEKWRDYPTILRLVKTFPCLATEFVAGRSHHRVITHVIQEGASLAFVQGMFDCGISVNDVLGQSLVQMAMGKKNCYSDVTLYLASKFPEAITDAELYKVRLIHDIRGGVALEKIQHSLEGGTHPLPGVLPLNRQLLLQLIADRAPLEHIQLCSELAMLEEDVKFGVTAVEAACKQKENFADVVRYLVRQVAGSLLAREENKKLAINTALKMPKMHFEILKALIDDQPGSLAIQDGAGWFPLHHACNRVFFCGKEIAYIALRYPKAVRAKTLDNSELPIHIFLKRPQLQSVKTAKTLVELYPASLSIKSGPGLLPLHMACVSGRLDDTLKFLAQKYPPAASIPCANGNLPLHYLLKGSVPCERWHYLLRGRSANLLQFTETLVDIHPESLAKRDCSGSLPLHIACEQDAESPNVIDFLAQKYPPSTGIPCAKGRLPLQILTRKKRCPYNKRGYDTTLQSIKAVFENYPGEKLSLGGLTRKDSAINEHMLLHAPPTVRHLTITDLSPTMKRATMVARLLPQLQSFECWPYSSSIHTQGEGEEFWVYLLGCLKENTSISSICLKFESSLLHPSRKLNQCIRDLCTKNSTLQKVDLEAEWHRDHVAHWDTSYFLRLRNLRVLRLNGHQRFLESHEGADNIDRRNALDALRKGHPNLHTLDIPDLINTRERVLDLLEILQDNTTLSNVRIDCQLPVLSYLKVKCYLNLNHFGRARTRNTNTTVSDIVEMLAAIENDQTRLRYPRDRVGMTFGILQNSLSLWTDACQQNDVQADSNFLPGSRKKRSNVPSVRLEWWDWCRVQQSPMDSGPTYEPRSGLPGYGAVHNDVNVPHWLVYRPWQRAKENIPWIGWCRRR